MQHFAQTHFITLRLAHPSAGTLVCHVQTLRAAMRSLLHHHPLRIDAMVILPDRLHAIWTLPPGDDDLGNRVGLLKSKFSREMAEPPFRSPAQIARGDKGIWKPGYWSERLHTLTEVRQRRDLLYRAPVAAGLCADPADWPHSSIHRDQDRRHARHRLPPPPSPRIAAQVLN
ncbi:MAG: transposase [Sulfitobacter sp.]|nr:transposase [Sulfitobacter sp.]